MQEALRQLATTFGSIQVRMAAQAYLEAFYQTFGFHTMSEPFYEEGLLHVTMNRQLTVPS
jgi:ElaA protein